MVSRAYLQGLIDAEIAAGIPAERIVLGGFSQGGAMSLLTGLTARTKLAGIVGLSSWLPLDSQLPRLLAEEGANANAQTPVLMAHGSADLVVPTAFGRESAQILRAAGFDVVWKEYPGMGHSACLEELDDVEEFLRKQLPPLGDKE
jgi:predicted esterase